MIIKNKFNKTKIIFGNNTRSYLSKLIKKKIILIVCSKRTRNEILQDKKLNFIKNNKVFWVDDVLPNPALDYLEKKNKFFKKRKFDYIVAIGGGSVIDSAKALSLLFSLKKKTIKTVIKNIGNLKINKFHKLIVLPTTSGTGSEVTPYSTIWDKKNKKKLSINHKSLLPTLAIIDPVLTYGLPKELTINTSLDALNQAFESIWNKNKNNDILTYAFKSIKLSLSALAKINNNINDKKSRLKLARASLYAGICIGQTRTSICHSISYPLTSHLNVPHGLACAFSMLAVINYINKKNNFFFIKLINALGLASFKIFEKKIKKLFYDLKVKDKNKFYIKSKHQLLLLKQYMQTLGRSDNFIYPINDNFLELILRKSYF
jgi:phosphonate metabolism-associated iron-containing alcohol dehydrogenase